MSKYPFHTIEPKWQKYWEEEKTFQVTEDESVPKERRVYLLDMFPYPSGAGLHVGHPEGYTATDIYGRYLKMNGYNVLHPMGFDSFGLPAENYAIQTGTPPAETTKKNIQHFQKQIKRLGFGYDWSREVSTHTPEYYRWTQYLFLQLYQQGLAYESEAPISWCPKCLTGLANEEVKEGRCERCSSSVERKKIRQWILKITAYAEKLLDGLTDLDWPNSVKTMQREWIGRSEGANVLFNIPSINETLEVYTTRPDTLFGATYMVIAPEHPLLDKIVTPEQSERVKEYQKRAANKSDLERTDLAKDKSGIFTGGYAVNPVNQQEIPIWISDYVLVSYGTGAIMAVPAHDQRDWEFAKEFDLSIIPVLKGGDISKEAHTGEGEHINSEFLNGLGKEEGISRILAWLEEKKLGEKRVNYKLRDWIFSRQRYWGEPIPLVHCQTCGIVPLPESELPLLLPETESYHPSNTGESPLANIEEWLSTSCPKCGGSARRETNTMPQWAGSCWYYLRYIDPKNSTKLVDEKKERYWMPVDLYVGGTEHATLHLLYARFWHRVFYEQGIVSTPEPFQRLVNQGMITSFSYRRENKSLVPTDEVEEIAEGEYRHREDGEPLEKIIAKMSKSLKNVVNPDEIIDEYGADAMRMYEMFMGPLQDSKPWQTNGLVGIFRFLNRIWEVSEKPMITEPPSEEVLKELHKTIKKVDHDTKNLNFNTAISGMMILINRLTSEKECSRSVWESFVLLLSPYAPHLAEELWEKLGNFKSRGTVTIQPWPTYDDALTKESEIEVVLQVNGKVRDKITLPADVTKEEQEAKARESQKIQSLLEGKNVVKVIVVPKRLVNFVVPS